MDLLTAAEETVAVRTRDLRSDIELLAGRVVSAIDRLRQRPRTAELPVANLEASTGAAAALVAATERPDPIRAVISRGGRPDLAVDALPAVQAPTSLIVGGDDVPVIGMNEQARDRMTITVRLEIVPGATHLFEEPGALDGSPSSRSRTFTHTC